MSFKLIMHKYNKMTKQFFLTVILFSASCFLLIAQPAITEMIVEKTTGINTPILDCNSPSLGILIFSSTIPGLEFKLNLKDKLKSQVFKQQENRYILCVEPTDRKYIITITCPDCKTATYTVEEIPPTSPLYFIIKSTTAGEDANKQGEKEYDAGNYAEAEQYFLNAVKEAPENPLYLRNLANTLRQQNKHTEAIPFMLRAIKISPNNAELHTMLGRSYNRLNRCCEAVECFQKAVDLNPSSQNNDALANAMDCCNKSALVPTRCTTIVPGGNMWGYKNENTDEIVISCQFYQAWKFSEHLPRLAKVAQNTTPTEQRANIKQGFIDENGKVVISLKYDEIYEFSKHFKDWAMVKVNGKYGFIDKIGTEVIPAKYSNSEFKFYEGLAVVKVGNFYGYINENGKEVIPCKYDEAGVFFNGRARVKYQNKDGCIDISGYFDRKCK